MAGRLCGDIVTPEKSDTSQSAQELQVGQQNSQRRHAEQTASRQPEPRCHTCTSLAGVRLPVSDIAGSPFAHEVTAIRLDCPTNAIRWHCALDPKGGCIGAYLSDSDRAQHFGLPFRIVERQLRAIESAAESSLLVWAEQ